MGGTSSGLGAFSAVRASQGSSDKYEDNLSYPLS